MPTTRTISEATTIAADQTVEFIVDGYNNTAIAVTTTTSFGPDYEFKNLGTIKIVDNNAQYASFGTIAIFYISSNFFKDSTFVNEGTVYSYSAHNSAYGLWSTAWSPKTTNTGTISAISPTFSAIGVGLWMMQTSDDDVILDNSGKIYAEGVYATAVRSVAGAIVNSGEIIAVGASDETIGLATAYTHLTNTGLIKATSTTGGSIGVWISPIGANGPRNGTVIENKGVIQGDTSIKIYGSGYVDVINTGSLIGDVELGGGADLFLNAGRVEGDVFLGAGDDSYDGRKGSVTGVIDAGAGDDIVWGGAGAEVLLGGDGDDYLAVGAGDQVTGGAGGDIFALAAGGVVQINDFAASGDRLSLLSGGTFTGLSVANGDTTLTYDGGSVVLKGVTTRSLAEWNALLVQVVAGTASDDVLTASGAKIYLGGAGQDTLSFSTAAHGVTVDLQLATQSLDGGVLELHSIENLEGSAFADVLIGNDAGNYLWGGDGDDELRGGGGDDVLDGGLGNDVIRGGGGIDIVDYSTATAGVTVDLSRSVQVTVMGTDTLESIEGVIGSAYNDYLAGSRLDGGAGDDQLIGAASDDLLIGGDGNDYLLAGAGADELRGGAGNDTLSGGAGNDILNGGAGADILIGGAGYDEMTGGDGADIFRFVDPTDSQEGLSIASDLIIDFVSGEDKIDLTAFDVSSYKITQDVGSITLRAETSQGVVVIRSYSWIKASDILFKAPAVSFDTPSALGGGYDFDGDGVSDIGWRSNSGVFTTSTTDVKADGSLSMTHNAYVNSSVSSDWSLVGTLDYNGDGKSDLLWRNTSGTFTIWSSTGESFTPNVVVNHALASTWHLAVTADLNGDGLDDLVWRKQSGEVSIWRSTGSGFTQDAETINDVASSWDVVASGDFNGDGKDDIVWRNGDGSMTIWSGSSGSLTRNSYVDFTVDSSWSLAAVADFNGDGKDDLLWRNKQGTFTEWLSNGAGFDKNTYVDSSVSTDWTLESVGDFDGDGMADLLWRHTSGVFTIWTSTGTSFEKNTLVDGSASSDWNLVA